MRIRTLCILAALLAAAPVLWSTPVHASEPVIRAHGENRGPGGGGDDDADDRDDDDDDGRAAVVVPGAPGAPAGSPAAPAAPAAPGPVAVSIANDAFQPASVSVAAGSPVTWTNRDNSRHTVTADSGAFDSGTLGGGSQFSFTFPTPGTFAYFCAIHSDMRGTVTVGGPAPVSAPPAAAAPVATPPMTVAAAPAPPDARGITVEAKDYAFTPARLTVGRGTEVTWRNTGRAPHTVTSQSFGSEELASGAKFAHTFDTPGTFEYRCELHPRMQGVVEVVADATAAPQGEEVGGFPIERVAAGGIIGAPLLLIVAAVFFFGRR